MPKTCLPFPWRALLSALAVYSAIQLSFLGLAPIAGSTEAREAQVIDAIVREGEWVLPLRNGIVPSKPPLFHWVGAVIGSASGGVSELVARLPSHLAALGILLCVALCAYALSKRSRTTESNLYCERAALLSAGVLSLTYGFHQLAAQAMVDMVFSLCVWGAIASVVCGAKSEDAPRTLLSARARSAFWLFCALAVLARGPLGLVLPVFLTFIGGAWVVGVRSTFRELSRPSVGWLAFVLPVAWYCAAYSQGGEAFLARQLFFENVQRFVGGEKVNTEVWWFYIPSLLRTTFPWGVLMLVALVFMQPRGDGVSYRGEYAGRILLLPFVMLVGGVLLFSLSSGKRHSYMLPLLPLMALQVGLSASWLLERGGMPFRQRVWGAARRAEILLSLGGIGLLVFAGLGLHGEWRGDPVEAVVKFALAPLTVRMGVVLFSALSVVVLVRKSRAWMLYSSVWVLMVLLMTIVVSSGSLVKATLKGFPLMTEQLVLLGDSGTRLVFLKDPSDEYFDPFFFYLHRRVEVVAPDEGSLPCESGVVYVARRALLAERAALSIGTIREMAVLQETLHALRRDGEQELSVFTCSPTGYPDERGERFWFEAKLPAQVRAL